MWTAESELPAAVVRLYDRRKEEARTTQNVHNEDRSNSHGCMEEKDDESGMPSAEAGTSRESSGEVLSIVCEEDSLRTEEGPGTVHQDRGKMVYCADGR